MCRRKWSYWLCSAEKTNCNCCKIRGSHWSLPLILAESKRYTPIALTNFATVAKRLSPVNAAIYCCWEQMTFNHARLIRYLENFNWLILCLTVNVHCIRDSHILARTAQLTSFITKLDQLLRFHWYSKSHLSACADLNLPSRVDEEILISKPPAITETVIEIPDECRGSLGGRVVRVFAE